MRKGDRAAPGSGVTKHGQAATSLDGVHSSVITGAAWEDFLPAQGGLKRHLSKPALTARTENIARKLGKLFALKKNLRRRNLPDCVLFLKRAEKCRPGLRSNNDFDVFDGDRLVGRILWNSDAPPRRCWYWSLLLRNRPRRRDRGYAATREIALEKFKMRWDRLRRVDSRFAT